MVTITGVEPVPKGRPRFTKGGRVYTPRETRQYEELVAWYTRKLPVYEDNVMLEAVFNCTRKSDLDNLVKSLLDGLQLGGRLKNDSQVTIIHACRLDVKQNPGVEFALTPLLSRGPLPFDDSLDERR